MLHHLYQMYYIVANIITKSCNYNNAITDNLFCTKIPRNLCSEVCHLGGRYKQYHWKNQQTFECSYGNSGSGCQQIIVLLSADSTTVAVLEEHTCIQKITCECIIESYTIV